MIATSVHQLKVSLSNKINILNRNGLEVPSASKVFRTIAAILALVKVRSVFRCTFRTLDLTSC